MGGFIAASMGWPWDFWIVLIIGALITITIEFFTRETNPRVLISGKVKRMQKELGRSDLRSCYDTGKQESVAKTLLHALGRPLKMLSLANGLFPIIIRIVRVRHTVSAVHDHPDCF
jgi:MFS family permease